MTITTINPTTGISLHTYQTWTQEQLENAVSAGHAAAIKWSRQSLEVRVAALNKLAAQLRSNVEPLSSLITAEMGKPLGEAAAEVEKSAVTAIYYANQISAMLSDEKVSIEGVDAWISYEAIGLVLAVMPWNFPVWQVMRFAIPAIAAGNGILLKHSPNVTGAALALEQLFVDAGLPVHLLTTLLIDEVEVPATVQRLISDDRVGAVTLTGSNRAGSSVGAAAGREIKKSVLELGGSDAFVVLDDADIPSAVAAAVKARYTNAGQSCVCSKRFIVSENVIQDFTERFVEGARALIVGDPTDRRTQIGPMARADLRDALQRQIEQSMLKGATLMIGGKATEGKGNFFEPTVLSNTGPGMPVFDEETFGPVAAIAVAKNDEDAIRLANATPYGLSVSIWTASRDRGIEVAKRIATGAVFINAITASDARLPFGGTKKSGYGRELASAGLREFVNVRTYWSPLIATG